MIALISRVIDDQVPARLGRGVPERVRRAVRDDHGVAGARDELLVADAEAERALDDVPGLVVAVVDVERRERLRLGGITTRVDPLDEDELGAGRGERHVGERRGEHVHAPSLGSGGRQARRD